MYTITTRDNSHILLSPNGGVIHVYSFNPQINGSSQRMKIEAEAHAKRMNSYWNTKPVLNQLSLQEST